MSSDEKTSPEGPFAKTVERLLARHMAVLKAELLVEIRAASAQTAQAIGNALGVWRAEVDQSLSDHEGRIYQLERAVVPDILRRLQVLESDRPTEPPSPIGDAE